MHLEDPQLPPAHPPKFIQPSLLLPAWPLSPPCLEPTMLSMLALYGLCGFSIPKDGIVCWNWTRGHII